MTSHAQYYLFLLILILAVIIPLHFWSVSPILNPDGVGFIRLAASTQDHVRDLLQSDWQEPLYPLLLGITQRLTSLFTSDFILSWSYAGLSLGVLGTILCSLAVFLITKKLFGVLPGILSATIVTILPELVEVSANTMTEPLFLGLLLLSAYFFLSAISTRTVSGSIFLVAFCCLFLMASFLVRKEALAIFPVYVIYLLVPKTMPTLKSRILLFVFLPIGLGLCFGGYLLIGGKVQWIETYYRAWIHKQFILNFNDLWEFRPFDFNSIELAKTIRTPWDLYWGPFHGWLKTCPCTVALAAMVYPLITPKHHKSPRVWLLFGVIGIFILIVYIHSLNRSYFVSRYLLPAVLFTIPIGSVVVLRLAIFFCHSLPQISLRYRILSVFFALLLLLAPAWIPCFFPRPHKSLNILAAAEWVNDNVRSDQQILTPDSRILFYSQRNNAPYWPDVFEAGLAQDKMYYQQFSYFIFPNIRGEEWKQKRFFQCLKTHNIPEPLLVKRIGKPGQLDILIYQPR